MKYEVKLGDIYRWLDASTPIQACMITLRELYEENWEVEPTPFFVTNIDTGDSEQVDFSVVVGFIKLSNEFVYDENEEPPLDMNSDIVRAGNIPLWVL